MDDMTPFSNNSRFSFNICHPLPLPPSHCATLCHYSRMMWPTPSSPCGVSSGATSSLWADSEKDSERGWTIERWDSGNINLLDIIQSCSPFSLISSRELNPHASSQIPLWHLSRPDDERHNEIAMQTKNQMTELQGVAWVKPAPSPTTTTCRKKEKEWFKRKMKEIEIKHHYDYRTRSNTLP